MAAAAAAAIFLSLSTPASPFLPANPLLHPTPFRPLGDLSLSRSEQWSTHPSRQLRGLHATPPPPSYLASSLPPVTLGVLSGLSIVLFKLSIASLQGTLYGDLAPLPLPLVPVLGGLGVVALNPGGKGGGGEGGGAGWPMDLRRVASGVLTLGSGNSLGPEAGCIELSTLLSSYTNTTSDLALASGLGGGFNSPIAGGLYALEKGSKDNVRDVFLASVSCALVTRVGLQNELAFTAPEVESLAGGLGAEEAMGFALLGVLSGLGSLGLDWLTAAIGERLETEDEKLNRLKPLLGGVICGLLGAVDPRVLFFGYDTLNSLLADADIPLLSLLALVGLKLVATAASKASGLVGGELAPSLFIGAALGEALHRVIASTGSSQAYAVVGAASFLGAKFGSPISAGVLVFELTKDYGVLIGLLGAGWVGCWVRGAVGERFMGDLLLDNDNNSNDQ